MKAVVIAVTLAVALVGCGKKDPGPTLIVVNGRAITAGELKEQVLVQAKLSELVGKPISAEQLPEWGNEKSIGVMQALLSSTLIEQDLVRQDLTPSVEDIERVLKDYNKALGRNADSFRALTQGFGSLGGAFQRHLERTAAVNAYQRKFWTPTVTDLMVRQHINFMSNRLERAAAIDAEARGKAEKAYQRLKNGEKWEKVAKECSEDKLLNPANARFEAEWLSVGPTALGMPTLAKVLPAMEKGDFSKPIETRDGMMIVRFLGMRGELYRLARMLFRMSRPVTVPKDAEQARKDLEEELFETRRQASLTGLWKRAQLEYPLGTNFTYKIWQ